MRGKLFYRSVGFVLLSVALMVADHRTDLLHGLRVTTSALSLPLHELITLPHTLRGRLQAWYPDDSIYRDYTALRQKQKTLEARLQRYDALTAENRRLLQLLELSRRDGDAALLANIVRVGLETFSHRLVIDRGEESGVYVGQPVVTPEGVVGQVTMVNYKRSVVTLITDRSHGLPVRVQRNGLRTIAQGSGLSNFVSVPFLSAQADIHRGDVLVTSGLGGRFPIGYKVAEVSEIVTDADEDFLHIRARVSANLDFMNEVLLLEDDARSRLARQAEAGHE